MKNEELRMKNFYKRISLLVVCLIFHSSFFILHSQTFDLAGAGGYEVSKDLGRFFDASLSQEVRFNQNVTNYCRFETTAEANYNFWRKQAKVGVLYSFINKENSDYLYENRHRFTLQAAYKHEFIKWKLSWRGRFQTTFRDETRGDYKINPKNYLRNRVQVDYIIRGSRFKPSLSCEFFYQLNNPDHNIIDQIRATVGTDYVLTRRSSLEVFLRYDKEIQVKTPAGVLMLGVFYKYKF
ncbi:MAG: DUF2490 domain-containing protein [Prevotellaceae bacterium]|jgi:hypothetical protein|nr:DUF2490 domain-containing protein [Prevotellaceae bacterium]